MRRNRIVVTTDYSEVSFRAFDIATEEAKIHNAELSLLAVIADWDVPPAFMFDIANPESIRRYRDELRIRGEERLKEYAETRFSGLPVTPHAVMSNEPVANVICDFAKDNQMDLLVMSSHGRGAIGALLIGSTVQRVIRQSPCPVLVVPNT